MGTKGVSMKSIEWLRIMDNLDDDRRFKYGLNAVIVEPTCIYVI